MFFQILLFVTFYVIAKHLLSKTQNLPPSPFPTLPIVGHFYLLKKPLHRTLTRLSNRYGSIIYLSFGSRPVLVVSSPCAAEECLATNDIIFANRPRVLAGKHLGYNFTALAWAPYGDHWRNLRRISSLELLSSHRLQTLSRIRTDEVRSLLRRLLPTNNKNQNQTEVHDLKSAFFELTLNVMMRMIAGKRYYGGSAAEAEEDQFCKFRNIVSETFRLGSVANVADFLPMLSWFGISGMEKRLILLQEKRDRFMQSLIKEHRRMGCDADADAEKGKKKKKTMIGVLLDLQESEPEYYKDEIIRGIMLMHEQNKGESSTKGEQYELWKQIWQLQTANPVKVFMWRACTDALPTKQNLCKRKVLTDSLCPICKQIEETPGHILWTCPSAQDVWMLGSRQLQKASVIEADFGGIFLQLLQRIGKSNISLFAEIARLLWTRRNKLVFEDTFLPPAVLISRAAEAHEEYQQAQRRQARSRPVSGPPSTTLWEAPPANWIKINWDIAIREADNRIGVGVAFRDSEGEILATLMQPLCFCSQPTVAEARGLVSAAILCTELGLQNVMFEGDSMQVVQAMGQHTPNHGLLSCLVQDAKIILAGTNWLIKHVKREANTMAHHLAQQAVLVGTEMIHIDNINPCIEPLVLVECNRTGFDTHVMAEGQNSV